MLQTRHHRQPGDDRPKRTGGRQGLLLLLCAGRQSAHQGFGSGAAARQLLCGGRLERTADGLCHIRRRKIRVGRAAPVRVAYRWCDSLPPVLATNAIRTLTAVQRAALIEVLRRPPRASSSLVTAEASRVQALVGYRTALVTLERSTAHRFGTD